MTVGLFTLFGVVLGFCLQMVWQGHRDRQETNAFLRAVRIEITEGWNRYNDAVGQDLSRHESGPFRNHFIAEQEYLVVYKCSAHRLGNVQDEQVQQAIERAYIYLNSLLDTHRTNNKIIESLNAEVERYAGIPYDQDGKGAKYAQEMQLLRTVTEHQVRATREQIDRHLSRHPDRVYLRLQHLFRSSCSN